MTLEYVLLAVVVVALCIVVYSGTGGRAWFGTRETPEALIGQTVQLLDSGWLGSSPPELPLARVTSYDPPDYRLDFTSPFAFEGRHEHFVRVRCRHRGYPVSGAARRSTWVSANLESGRGFIAKIAVSSNAANVA